MYIEGLTRTASKPSRTVILLALYSAALPFCAVFSLIELSLSEWLFTTKNYTWILYTAFPENSSSFSFLEKKRAKKNLCRMGTAHHAGSCPAARGFRGRSDGVDGRRK
jgi:hypothetical protein